MDLSFAKIIILREDIAEVIINKGVELDMKMVEQFHEFLLSHLSSKFSLLINRINSYTYDFDAQMNIGTLKEINVIAVLAYNRRAKISTEMLASLPRENKWNYKIFTNRDEALSWVESEQDNLTGHCS